MRDYGRVAPTFWTRGSGKKLRGNPRAQLVALYLFTCPSSTMIGIYHLAIPTMAHETGLTVEEAERALAEVCAIGIALHDPEEELVYLPEGARYQIGERLKPGDRRVKGIASALAQFSRHPFALDFVRRYQADFCLQADTDGRGEDAPPGPSEPSPVSVNDPQKGVRTPFQDPAQPLGSQARQGKDQASTEIPPVAPARPRDDGEGQGMAEVRPQAPPSPLGAAIADAQVLLAAVARHPMLVTLHGDRRWAQNASSGFMTAAVRAGDVDAAVEAFVTGEAAKAPEHPEALAAWVRDGAGGSGGIGRYLKKAKQHGDDARARAEREASRRRERPSSPRSPDAQAVLETFGPVWAAKKRRAFVPATTDERHAAEVAARAQAAAPAGTPWLDVVKHWAERHLASQDRLVVESDNALRTLGMQLTAYGLPKPPREKPPTLPPAEPLAGAPMPPGMLDAIGAQGPREGAMMRRPGGPS